MTIRLNIMMLCLDINCGRMVDRAEQKKKTMTGSTFYEAKFCVIIDYTIMYNF